jgi:Bacterial SH3 domain
MIAASWLLVWLLPFSYRVIFVMKSLNILSVGLATVTIVASTAIAAVAQPGWIAGDTTNVRDQPSTQGRVVTYTDRGDRVEILASRINPADGYGWYQVQLPNRSRGWVRADLVRISTGTTTANPIPRNIGGGERPGVGSDTDIGATVRLQGAVSVRRSPGLDGAIAFTGNRGDRVFVKDSYRGRDGIWLHVTYPMALSGVESSGWVQRNLTR